MTDRHRRQYPQVTRSELEAKASKSAGETQEEAKAAADAAAAAAKSEGPKADHVQIDESSFLINLIDSPGHVDFSSEVRLIRWMYGECILLILSL